MAALMGFNSGAEYRFTGKLFTIVVLVAVVEGVGVRTRPLSNDSGFFLD
jgi:hypothetical protein